MKGEDYGKKHKVKKASSLIKGDLIQPDGSFRPGGDEPFMGQPTNPHDMLNVQGLTALMFGWPFGTKGRMAGHLDPRGENERTGAEEGVFGRLLRKRRIPAGNGL
jgi:hypothetical protein